RKFQYTWSWHDLLPVGGSLCSCSKPEMNIRKDKDKPMLARCRYLWTLETKKDDKMNRCYLQMIETKSKKIRRNMDRGPEEKSLCSCSKPEMSIRKDKDKPMLARCRYLWTLETKSKKIRLRRYGAIWTEDLKKKVRLNMDQYDK
ncbi:hypothetical protein PROFUN_16377, partial [Planoprotostelium fungivorum]